MDALGHHFVSYDDALACKWCDAKAGTRSAEQVCEYRYAQDFADPPEETFPAVEADENHVSGYWDDYQEREAVERELARRGPR